MEIDNEKSPLKTMWPLLDLLLNGRLKKIKCRRSPPKFIGTQIEAFYISDSSQFLGDINPSLLTILERLVAHKCGSLQMLDLVFKRLHLCGLIYT